MNNADLHRYITWVMLWVLLLGTMPLAIAAGTANGSPQSDLARALAINGTPGFVIGDEIVRGATSLDHLQQLIKLARDAQ